MIKTDRREIPALKSEPNRSRFWLYTTSRANLKLRSVFVTFTLKYPLKDSSETQVLLYTTILKMAKPKSGSEEMVDFTHAEETIVSTEGCSILLC